MYVQLGYRGIKVTRKFWYVWQIWLVLGIKEFSFSNGVWKSFTNGCMVLVKFASYPRVKTWFWHLLVILETFSIFISWFVYAILVGVCHTTECMFISL